MSLMLTGNFMPANSSFLAKPLSAFAVLAGGWFGCFNYLTVLHLKDSLSSILWILMNSFFGLLHCLDNFI